MAAYFVFSYDVNDPKGYESYVPGVIPLLQKHNCEILVADYESSPIEGNPPRTTIVLKFDTEDAAMAWYNDVEYTPVKNIRLNATSNASGVLVKGFKPPG